MLKGSSSKERCLEEVTTIVKKTINIARRTQNATTLENCNLKIA